ncbi:hypothetical protein F66182_4657 [Fusarium sp. NRRL 66182]|nr:hypothetical protein F66182_4657 [Fusarium sp. NRRL 66182]
MPTSIYDLVIPTFTRGLKMYHHILTKAEEYAKEKGLNADQEFVQAKLVEDQLPLLFQVQNTTNIAHITVGRLTGAEPRAFENNEKTLAELRVRVQNTIDLLKSVKPEDVNSREDATTNLQVRTEWIVARHILTCTSSSALGKTYQVSVKKAILEHGQTNFFFHLVTGYSILRAKGVPVGKADYLGSFLDL